MLEAGESRRNQIPKAERSFAPHACSQYTRICISLMITKLHRIVKDNNKMKHVNLINRELQPTCNLSFKLILNLSDGDFDKFKKSYEKWSFFVVFGVESELTLKK